MTILKAAASAVVRVVASTVVVLAQGHAWRRSRGLRSRAPNELREFDIDGTTLQERFVGVDGYSHLVTEAGDPDADESRTVVLMGGIPTDSSETFHWVVAELCRLDPGFRCVILHLPHTEEATEVTSTEPPQFSTLNGLSLPFDETIDLSRERLDIRYDQKNQAVAAHRILTEIGIGSAHLVGHDRGAVVFDYLVVNHPDFARSFSRGAQLWDNYDEDWAALAPKVIVGPPHRYMVQPWQLRFLFIAVNRLGKPIRLLSPGFSASVKRAKRGTEDYERKMHLLIKALNVSDSTTAKIRQVMMQTDSTLEVAHRSEVRTTPVPIMQFQGEDEFAYDRRGTLVSDQPYFGVYNLFANEVEDLYPNCVGQDPAFKRDELLVDQGLYKLLQLKRGARMSRFALIPDSAHFHIIENPAACAAAIQDFVASVNAG